MKLVELIIKKKQDVGVFAVSLVEKPAIKQFFVKFADETEKVVVKFAIDEEKQIITGPAMIPELRMYRSAGSIGLEEESMVYFTEESIRNAAAQFLAQDFTNSVTLQHESVTEGLTLRESWIVEDPKLDKYLLYGFSEMPKGTWFLSYDVNDPAIWAKIKDGTFAGFSIEAFFMPRVTDQEVPYEFQEDNFVITRKPGESDDELMGRCIGIEIANGYPSDQAAAICHSKIAELKQEEFSESFMHLVLEWVEMNKSEV